MEEGSIANREEAEKCRDLAKELLKRGEYAKAERFFEKSLKLFPLPGVAALKEKAYKLSGSQPATSSNQSERSVPSSSDRSYTPDQEAGSRKVLANAKISHYAVLGLQPTCTTAEIKKAYKRLALQYHPDKNPSPSAREAFQAIGEASQCLSDGASRELYDSTGGTAQAQEEHGHHHGGYRQAGQVDPEELYRMFFQSFQGGGGGVHFGNMRHRGFNMGGAAAGGGGAGQRARTAPQGLMGQIMQFLPIILLVLMSFSSFSTPPPQYSLNRTSAYPIRRETMFGSSAKIPYYTPAGWENTYKPFSEGLRRVEGEVEKEYRNFLGQKCKAERVHKSNRQYQARFSGSAAREAAEKMELPSCDEYKTRWSTSDRYF